MRVLLSLLALVGFQGAPPAFTPFHEAQPILAAHRQDVAESASNTASGVSYR